MRRQRYLFLSPVLFLAFSCGTKPAATNGPNDGPHAKLTLKDGSFLTGKVLSSSPSEVTIAGDDNQNHTVSTSQVRSLEYEDAVAQSSPAPADTSAPSAPSAAPLPAPAPVTPAAPVTKAVPKAQPAPERAFGSNPDSDHYHPSEAAIQSRTFTVNSGTSVPVRTEETIDSGKAVEGQTFAAEITRDILDNEGRVVIPRNSNAQIVIRSAAKGNRFHGQSDLALDLESISVGGRRYRVSTADIVQKGKQGIGANKRTGIFTGGGSAFGAIIGAIAGGGKGAAIGALSGAAAGAGTQMITKGGSIKVPAETILTFRLDRPLRIEEDR